MRGRDAKANFSKLISSDMKLQKESVSFEDVDVSESESLPLFSVDDISAFSTLLEIIESKQQTTSEEGLDKHDSPPVFDGSASSSNPLLSKKSDFDVSLRSDMTERAFPPTEFMHEDVSFSVGLDEDSDKHSSPFVFDDSASSSFRFFEINSLVSKRSRCDASTERVFSSAEFMHEDEDTGFSLGLDNDDHSLDEDMSAPVSSQPTTTVLDEAHPDQNNSSSDTAEKSKNSFGMSGS